MSKLSIWSEERTTSAKSSLSIPIPENLWSNTPPILSPAVTGSKDGRNWPPHTGAWEFTVLRPCQTFFLKNTGYIQKAYTFSDAERAAFPVLFRYMNTYWWHHIDELKLVKEEPEKVGKILDWLEYQMTRDDLRLP